MPTPMSAADIRAFVRAHLDVDVATLPDTVINVFLAEGYDRLIGYFDESPDFFRVEYSFTSVVGRQTYSLDGPEITTSPAPLQHVRDVRGDLYSLRPADHRQVRNAYRTTNAPTSKPTEFSLWGRTLYLWPTPSVAITYAVTGIRQPQDWITAGAQPDCPADFHQTIALWVLHRCYLQQDDLYAAGFLRDEFFSSVANLARRWKSGNDAQPLVVGGSRSPEPFRVQTALQPPVYDWE